MAFGRGGIDREGIGTWHSTYAADTALKGVAGDGRTTLNRDAVIGKAVAPNGASACGYGSDGDPLLGAILQYEYDGYVSVTTRGYVTLPAVKSGGGTARLPNVGEVVVVNGAGAVKHDSTLKYGPRVDSVDATANTVVVFLG